MFVVSRVMKKLPNKFHQGALTTKLWLIFAGVALKREEVGTSFQVSIHVHPYHPGLTIFCDPRQETVSIL